MNRPRGEFCYSNVATGMAAAVLAEIGEHLEALAGEGHTNVIDLRSLPLTDADLENLSTRLGRGEVSARVDVIGETEVFETAYAGVWWIRHLGADHRVAAEEIAITPIPEILCSQPEDIALAAVHLRKQLEAEQSAEPEREAIHG